VIVILAAAPAIAVLSLVAFLVVAVLAIREAPRGRSRR
jgi:hypothetical protein